MGSHGAASGRNSIDSRIQVLIPYTNWGSSMEYWVYDQGQYHLFKGGAKLHSQDRQPRNVWVYSKQGWIDGEEKKLCYWDSGGTVRYRSDWGDEDDEGEDKPLISADDPRNSGAHTPYVDESTNRKSHGTNARSTSLLNTKEEVISPLKTEEETPGYLTIMAPKAPNPNFFLIRTEDSKLCLTILLQMAGYDTAVKRSVYVRENKNRLNPVLGTSPHHRGRRVNWVDIQIGVNFCNTFLPKVAPALVLTLQKFGYFSTYDNENLQEEEEEEYQTIVLAGRPMPNEVVFTKRGLVNLTHILKIAGFCKLDIQAFREGQPWLGSMIVRSKGVKIGERGTYVKRETALRVCGQFNLLDLKEAVMSTVPEPANEKEDAIGCLMSVPRITHALLLRC